MRACCEFVGDGGEVTFPVSERPIHRQVPLYGSRVASLAHMEQLRQRLVRWNVHPEWTVTRRFSLGQADEAYRVSAG